MDHNEFSFDFSVRPSEVSFSISCRCGWTASGTHQMGNADARAGSAEAVAYGIASDLLADHMDDAEHVSFEQAETIADLLGVDLAHDCDRPDCAPGGFACHHDLERIAAALVDRIGDPDLRLVRRECGEGWETAARNHDRASRSEDAEQMPEAIAEDGSIAV